MTLELNEKQKNVAVTVGWGVTLASIILQRLYQGPLLTAQEYILIFVISALAAAIIVDARTVIFGWAWSTFISIVIMFICLTIPGMMDRGSSGLLLGFLYGGVIVMVFRAIFPTAIITCFLGAIVGGTIGERIAASATERTEKNV